MKTNELYIEQVNQFCEANCKVTAEDILTKAKQRQAENVLTETTSQMRVFHLGQSIQSYYSRHLDRRQCNGEKF